MNPVLVLAVAAALAASAIARPLDSGGRIGDYIERIVSASGKRHEIRGDCMSACTLWLGHAGVCVAPDAKLWFHAPRDAGSSRFQGSSVRSSKQSGVKTLMAVSYTHLDVYKRQRWARRLTKMDVIGKHIFYRLKPGQT